MVNQHGTMPMIRQCVTHGMWVSRHGRNQRVLAVVNEKRWMYLQTERGPIRISDCVVDVLLDVSGKPLIH